MLPDEPPAAVSGAELPLPGGAIAVGVIGLAVVAVFAGWVLLPLKMLTLEWRWASSRRSGDCSDGGVVARAGPCR